MRKKSAPDYFVEYETKLLCISNEYYSYKKGKVYTYLKTGVSAMGFGYCTVEKDHNVLLPEHCVPISHGDSNKYMVHSLQSMEDE